MSFSLPKPPSQAGVFLIQHKMWKTASETPSKASPPIFSYFIAFTAASAKTQHKTLLSTMGETKRSYFTLQYRQYPKTLIQLHSDENLLSSQAALIWGGIHGQERERWSHWSSCPRGTGCSDWWNGNWTHSQPQLLAASQGRGNTEQLNGLGPHTWEISFQPQFLPLNITLGTFSSQLCFLEEKKYQNNKLKKFPHFLKEIFKESY